jgi:hypothetical protein
LFHLFHNNIILKGREELNLPSLLRSQLPFSP